VYILALELAPQLTKERAAGNVFNGFNENKLGFPPTYKYRRGHGQVYVGDPGE
jgi:hypothetical protein